MWPEEMKAIFMVKRTNLSISNVTKALFTHSQCLDLATLSKNLLHHLLWGLSFIHTFKDNDCILYGRMCIVTDCDSQCPFPIIHLRNPMIWFSKFWPLEKPALADLLWIKCGSQQVGPWSQWMLNEGQKPISSVMLSSIYKIVFCQFTWWSVQEH